MESYTSLQKAIEYIETHLLEELNFEIIARQVHMSGYEFHRAFRFLSGMTVTAYIRNRRLSLAGQELLQTDARVTDIALKYGYETSESFSKAFTRFHGTAPSYIRRKDTSLKLFQPLVVKLIMEGGKSMDYRIVTTETKTFITWTKAFPNTTAADPDNHDIPDFWDEPETQAKVEMLRALCPDGKKDLYGLCSPKKDDTFDYGIGILIDDDTADYDEAALLAAGYAVRHAGPGTYAVFECVGDTADCISEMWSRFYKEFLPQMGYTAAQTTDYEIYFEKGRPGLFCELWIPIEK